jgi:hypothetical protein
MSDPETQNAPPAARPPKAVDRTDQAREARLAAALRANLRRRKTGAKTPD